MSEKIVAENIIIRARRQPEDRIRIENVSETWLKQKLVSLAEKLGLKPVEVTSETIEIRGRNNHSNQLRISRARAQERQAALEELRELLKRRGIQVYQKPDCLKKRLKQVNIRRIKPSR